MEISRSAATFLIALPALGALAYISLSGKLESLNAENAALEKAAAGHSEAARLLQDRVDALAKDGCQAIALKIRALNAKQPLTTLGDLPPQLRSDVALCYDRAIMYAYVRGNLDDAGLTDILDPPR